MNQRMAVIASTVPFLVAVSLSPAPAAEAAGPPGPVAQEVVMAFSMAAIDVGVEM